MSAIDQTFFKTFFEERPNRIIVFFRHGEIGIIPIHPITKSDRLIGDAFGAFIDAIFTILYEFIDAVFANLLFRCESVFFFDFDFDP